MNVSIIIQVNIRIAKLKSYSIHSPVYTLDSSLFSEAVVVVDHKDLSVEVVLGILAVEFMNIEIYQLLFSSI